MPNASFEVDDRINKSISKQIGSLTLKVTKFLNEVTTYVDTLNNKKKTKSEKDTNNIKRVAICIDSDFKTTLRRLEKEVTYILSDNSLKLYTLNNIADIKHYFNHLFLIQYKQRTDKYLMKYCIVIFKDFNQISSVGAMGNADALAKIKKDIQEYREVVHYFKENDIRVTLGIYSEKIDKGVLKLLTKIDNNVLIMKTSGELCNFLRGYDNDHYRNNENSLNSSTNNSNIIEMM